MRGLPAAGRGADRGRERDRDVADQSQDGHREQPGRDSERGRQDGHDRRPGDVEDQLQLLLSTALQTFTHYAVLRGALTDLWPPLMDRVMEHVEQHGSDGSDSSDDGDDGDNSTDPQSPSSPVQRAVPPVELVPHPLARLFAPDAHQAVADATGDWIPPEAVATAVQRWTRVSPPSVAAVEALLGLVATADPIWQATTGLSWITALVGGRYQNVSRSAQLVDWIRDLHNRGSGIDAAVVDPLVDGLVAHGASRLVELQRRGEQTDPS